MAAFQEIEIRGDGVLPQDLYNLIAEHSSVVSDEFRLELRHPKRRLRTASDPSILVAIVAGSSAGIAALVSGLLRVLETRQNGRVVLRGAGGQTVEVPAETSDDKLREYIELARSLDRPNIMLKL